MNLQILNTKLPVNDYITVIRNFIINQWQRKWSDEPNENKLKQIKSSISLWNSSIQNDKKTEVILTRLRIGHTRLTHGFLMSTPHGDAPICNTCDKFLTVKHILCECKVFRRQRALCFGSIPIDLPKILGESENFSISKILMFLRNTGFINQI